MTRKVTVKLGGKRKKRAPKSDGFTPSPQQQAIFDEFEEGEDHVLVRARAGCGKTSTIVRAIEFAPESRILLCAFNKKIARELEDRLTNPRAVAKTLHGVGYGIVRANWNIRGIDDERARKLAIIVCGKDVPKTILNLVAKLHTKGREMAPFAAEPGDLMPLAYQFDCIPDEQWEEDGYDAAWVEARALEAMAQAADVEPVGGIDFADMLYLPVRNRWLRPKYNLVVVDEAQDMNATQLLIAQGVAKGRIVVVGDDRQAIYAFRGADSNSLDRLKDELNAKEFGLTETFRCGKAIVATAQELVPDFVANDANAEGEIRELGYEALAEEAEVGDFILSRTNAPLVKTALAILRTGTRCKIEGRDIGKGLIALVRRMAKDCSSMPDLLEKLERWRSREVERAERSGHKGAEAKVERVNDQAMTIVALAEDLTSARELCVRIEDLFTNRNGAPQVTCSSVHRAKGLEAERVYVLRDTLMGGAPCECGHWSSRHRVGACNGCACRGVFHEDAIRAQEEANIKYVAITRAKQTLVWVAGGR